jgi:hypothetical protein
MVARCASEVGHRSRRQLIKPDAGVIRLRPRNALTAEPGSDPYRRIAALERTPRHITLSSILGRTQTSFCLVYLVENEMNAMSKKEADACIEESLVCDDALRIAGAVDYGASPVRTMR